MYLRHCIAVFVTCLLFVQSAIAQEEAVAFEFQGEYSGEVKQGDKTLKAGVQIIARGDHKFDAKFYIGGLPGDGWKPDTKSDGQSDVSPENGSIVITRDNDRIVIADGALKYFHHEEFGGELKRVVRESETLGKFAPEGATVLFDGSSGDNFTAQDGNDPFVDGLLRQGIISKQKFGGDFSVHIEFKLPFEPSKTGQARGNSGLYLQGRYEVQMLDSFGLAGEHNECGGIYSVKKPDVNMCYPPESWQTYDIDFTSAKWDGETKTSDARMTVKHNGVLIHDDVEVPKTTTAAPLKESAEPGYLYLQDHGSPVRYRNIWVVEN